MEPDLLIRLFEMLLKHPPDCREQVRDTRPVCPACGELECLCRPRFFAGQLLTEEDLNRLDQYVIGKNRLHNRYLFGSGVACGLEVERGVCDADGNLRKVVVKPGYALSPCGNDIVVSRHEPVDVCDLINRCRPSQADECVDPNAPHEALKADAGADWVLAVCYDEKPSRGVTALRSPGATPSCKCGCGGRARSGGCGCQDKAKAYAPKASAAPTFTAAQCEPTMVCETYRFVAYKASEKAAVQWGELVTRLWCCMAPLLEKLRGLPEEGIAADDLQVFIVESKRMLYQLVVSQRHYDSELAQRTMGIATPDLKGATVDQIADLFKKFITEYSEIAGDLLKKCLCTALLPPCPPQALVDCVPLATVTVRPSPCRVIDICNLRARSFLVTVPNLEYWLSWMPPFVYLRRWIELICCKPTRHPVPIGPPFRKKYKATATVKPTDELSSKAAESAGNGDFAEAMWGGAVEPQRKMDAARFLLGAMGATDANDRPLVSDAELKNPAAALLSQVMGPALSGFFPQALIAVAGAKRGEESAALARKVADLEEKARKVDDLESKVNELQQRIERKVRKK